MRRRARDLQRRDVRVLRYSPQGTAGDSDFDPLSLFPVLLLDAAVSSITYNIAPLVSAYADSSGVGSGKDFVQATPTDQMLYEASVAGLNGEPSLRSITADFMTNNAALAAGDFTAFIVCRPTVISNHDYVFFSNRPGAFDGSNLIYAPTGYAANSRALVLVYRRTGSTLMIRANGPTNTASGAFTTAAITTTNILASNSGNAGPFTGYIPFVMLCNSSLSTTAMSNMENYLGSRYGAAIA
jgi:hypothetical protein